MSDQEIDDLEGHSPTTGRARPGLQGMGFKTALFLLLIALAPLAGLPIFLSDAGERVLAALPGLQAEHEALQKELHDRDEAIARLQREIAKEKHELEVARFARQHRAAQDKLAAALSGLIAALAPEDVPASESISKAIAEAPPLFDEVALIRIEDGVVLLAKKAKAGKAIAEVLPELAARWKKDAASPGPTGMWNWKPLGKSGLLLAVRSSPPPAPAAGVVNSPAPLAKSEALGQIEKLGTDLRTTVLSLSIGLPLFGIALALIGLWWLFGQILAPVRRLTAAGRLALDDPAEEPADLLGRAGQLQDLADSILRLRERHLRLRAAEEADEQRRGELSHIKLAVERAAAGHLGLRVPLNAGETEELALAINRLLESFSGWIDNLRGIGQQLVSTSQRLTPVASRLAERISREEDAPVAPGALADFLEVQIDGLCQTASQLAEEFDRSAPPALTNSDIEAHRSAMAGPGTGLRLLTERISEVAASSARLSGLRQDTEVLATNLAISAEANSPGQIEKLVSDARSLSRAVVDLSDVLQKTLGQLSDTGDDMKAAFGRVNEQYVQVVRQLADWEALRRAVGSLRSDLDRQLSAVRPSARTLGADLRNLAKASTSQRKQQRDLSETLDAAGRSVTALAATTQELIDLLDKIDTGRPAPAAVTQRLAEQRQALEVAVRELTDAARDEGIEALSQDAQKILASIRTLADDARERIMQVDSPPPEGEAAAPSDEPEAEA